MIRICFTHTRISHVLSTRLNEDIDVILVFPVNAILKHHQPNPARETLLVCHPRRLHEFRASLGEGLATIKSPQFYGLCERERERGQLPPLETSPGSSVSDQGTVPFRQVGSGPARLLITWCITRCQTTRRELTLEVYDP